MGVSTPIPPQRFRIRGRWAGEGLAVQQIEPHHHREHRPPVQDETGNLAVEATQQGHWPHPGQTRDSTDSPPAKLRLPFAMGLPAWSGNPAMLSIVIGSKREGSRGQGGSKTGSKHDRQGSADWSVEGAGGELLAPASQVGNCSPRLVHGQAKISSHFGQV